MLKVKEKDTPESECDEQTVKAFMFPCFVWLPEFNSTQIVSP